jgi:hypothetical protein
MEVENRVPVEVDFIGGVDQKLDRLLVIDDHLRFEPVAARGLLAEFDEAGRDRVIDLTSSGFAWEIHFTCLFQAIRHRWGLVLVCLACREKP